MRRSTTVYATTEPGERWARLIDEAVRTGERLMLQNFIKSQQDSKKKVVMREPPDCASPPESLGENRLLNCIFNIGFVSLEES